MKHGPEHAKRLKRLFGEMTRKFGRPAPAAELEDPVEQLVVGILSACSTRSRAEAVFKKLREQVVDLNELRVTPPVELADMIGSSLPLARVKAHRIVEALNAIRRRQDSLDISFLKQRGRREAREYLESLHGVDKAAAAHVVLYGLGGHAIPVDDLTLYVLLKDEIVEAGSDLLEVQAFLERQIAASEARLFSDLLSRHVAARGARVVIEKLPGVFRPAANPQPPKTMATADPNAKPVAATTADVKKPEPATNHPKKAAPPPAKKPVAVAAKPAAPAHAAKSAAVVVAAKRPAVKAVEHKTKPTAPSHNGANTSKAGLNRKKK
jgi:endonuclease III